MQKKKELIYRVVSNILRILIMISAITFFLNKDFKNVGYLLIAFILTFYDVILKKVIKIYLDIILKFALLFLIFIAQYLGSVYNWYGMFLWWDTLVHCISGIIFFYVGLTLIEQVNKKVSKNRIPLVIKIMFAICFSMSIGVIWEFIEFTVDKYLNGNMQVTKGLVGQDAIWDTMEDLLAASMGIIIGTLVESVKTKTKANTKYKKI